ncbi:hypothetical protein EVAR_97975_1 [Eumeta japonica]|uniref:Uncharacterized protein n=1 Tax=Eumeta variegata TaxID=151549 RepID=A0A4C1XDF8_EUMVA|nr:hypothetical protein EVAR_97975_1 [Eumeta japonica]
MYANAAAKAVVTRRRPVHHDSGAGSTPTEPTHEVRTDQPSLLSTNIDRELRGEVRLISLPRPVRPRRRPACPLLNGISITKRRPISPGGGRRGDTHGRRRRRRPALAN